MAGAAVAEAAMAAAFLVGFFQNRSGRRDVGDPFRVIYRQGVVSCSQFRGSLLSKFFPEFGESRDRPVCFRSADSFFPWR